MESESEQYFPEWYTTQQLADQFDVFVDKAGLDSWLCKHFTIRDGNGMRRFTKVTFHDGKILWKELKLSAEDSRAGESHGE